MASLVFTVLAVSLPAVKSTYDPKCAAPDCVETCSPAFSPPCVTDVGKPMGGCKIFGCSKRLGATNCIKSKCLCAEGHCPSDDGSKCVPNPKTKVKCISCLKSVGTCKIFHCHSYRGATDCVNGVCLCAGDKCGVGKVKNGKCVDKSEIPTAEHDLDDEIDLGAKDAARKAAHVAIWTIVMIIVGGCLCAGGVAYGIYALCCKQADGRELKEQLLLG